MTVGSRILWPCDAHKAGSVGTATKQVAVGVIEQISDLEIVVRVERRSRTGAPKVGYDRELVRLKAVGMANATVIP